MGWRLEVPPTGKTLTQTGKTSGDVPSSPFPPTRSRSGSASPRSGRLSRARRAPRERLRVALAVKESRSVEVKKNRTKVEVKGVVEGIKRTIFVWISVSVRRSDIRTSIQRSSPVATGQVGCRVPLDQFHAQPFRLCSICSHQPHNDIGTQHGCRVKPIYSIPFSTIVPRRTALLRPCKSSPLQGLEKAALHSLT